MGNDRKQSSMNYSVVDSNRAQQELSICLIYRYIRNLSLPTCSSTAPFIVPLFDTFHPHMAKKGIFIHRDSNTQHIGNIMRSDTTN